MLSTLRQLPRNTNLPLLHRTLATATQTHFSSAPRAEGDISSVFASLSGNEAAPLPPRFADIKASLIHGRESEITASWSRLLSSLRSEIDHISAVGSDIFPSLDFSEIENHSRVHPFANSLRKRGAAIIRGVVPEDKALEWKSEIIDYIVLNPETKAFPKENPAVFELYWSPGQVKARAHENVLATQKFLMSFWHKEADPEAFISTEHPVSYADRVRIRQPGDSGFALGPHVDGGSAERWESNGYGLGKVYDKIFEGKWEAFDPWESSGRIEAESDLYNGAGACSMFRMFQGWLSMSNTGPGEGTLLVNPLFKMATAYILLRPFFSPKNAEVERSGFLDESNWELEPEPTPLIQGATLGMTQELDDALHPHLELSKTMIHMPKVRPGDYVAWHCDSIHAVDKIHAGCGDSSVLYIPACPLTENNARYLVRQREAFLKGLPGPDFPGGEGESNHIDRGTMWDIEAAGGEHALNAMGFGGWSASSRIERKVVKAANEIVSERQRLKILFPGRA